VAALFFLTLRQTLVLRQGDAQVFFRAGWAVWTGYPLYQITDDHGWSYLYPPFFALLMGPFANPPAGIAQPAWAAPYPLALALWCAIGVAALGAAMQILANAIARFSGARLAPGADNPYWALRLAPPLAMVAFVAVGWIRGQPTAILVLLVVMSLVFVAERKPIAAAIPLAIAIAIKIFPAAFLLIPLLRRDLRTIGWTALFTALFLFAVPLLCLGLDATIALYRALWTQRLEGLAVGHTAARVADELSPWSINVTSFGAMLARAFGTPDPDAPAQLPTWARLAQYAFDLAVLLAVSGAGYRRFWRLKGAQPDAPYATLIAGAILAASLPAILPVARPHYWALAIPLVTILYIERWRRTGRVLASVGEIAWTTAAILAFALTGASAPGVFSRLGPTTIVMMVPLVAGLIALRRLPEVDAAAPSAPIARPATAA
jgi:hypothetical protein